MLVAYRIQSIAGRDLVHIDDFGKMTPAEQRERVDEVKRWAAAHHGRTESDLILESLRTTHDWGDFNQAMDRAREQKVVAAAPILLSRLDDPDFSAGRMFLLMYACELDSARAIAKSRTLVHDEDDHVRAVAAQILLSQSGADADLAIETLSDMQREHPEQSPATVSFDRLMNIGKPEAIELAATALRPQAFPSGGDDPLHMAQRLILAGREPALAYVIGLLHQSDFKVWVTPQPGAKQIQVSVQNKTANDLAAWRRDIKSLSYTASEEEFGRRRAEMEEWLREQFALIQAGKPSEIVASARSPR
jgi:hypothetical protein